MTHNDLKHNDLVALLERAHALLAAYAYEFSRPNFTDRYADGPRCKLMADRIDAALAALRSGEAVLCPREPTEEMDDEARRVAYQYYEQRGPIFKACYRAMLDCAKGK